MWKWENPVDKAMNKTVRQNYPQNSNQTGWNCIGVFPRCFFNIYKSLSALLGFPRYYYYYCIYI